MSHHIYTTEGVVIEGLPRGETGKVLRIFTRDLGMVYARATGLRSNASKLRYHTQDHTHGSFSLVRGREVWRLTGASSTSNTGSASSAGGGTDNNTDKSIKALYARVLALLKRMLPGEEAHPELFDVIDSFRNRLLDLSGKKNILDKEELRNIECLVVLRIIDRLGYLKDDLGLRDIVSSDEWGRETVGKIASKRKNAILLINEALRESQL